MQKITVAIVEDTEEIREGLVQYLGQRSEFSVLGSFSNAEDAIRKLPALMPDIVIMDINLPGLSGIDCINEVKSKCAGIQFIMFTIYEDDEKVFEAIKAGATGYLLKNVELPLIEHALKDLHHGGAPMSAIIARKLINAFQKDPATLRSPLLTERENQVLQLLAKGLFYKEIADVLSISISTVRQHIHKIYEKLHVQNRMEAINKLTKGTH